MDVRNIGGSIFFTKSCMVLYFGSWPELKFYKKKTKFIFYPELDFNCIICMGRENKNERINNQMENRAAPLDSVRAVKLLLFVSICACVRSYRLCHIVCASECVYICMGLHEAVKCCHSAHTG